MTDVTAATASSAEPRLGSLYRAVWRWHFYAGLIVLPFMILLAVTGGIYLFKDEINVALQSDLRTVTPAASAPLPPSKLVAAALAAHPGRLRSYMPAAAADQSAQLNITRADGVRDTVFVDPYTGNVLGSALDGGSSGSSMMLLVRQLHSLDYVGWWASRIIEAVAGWAVLLVATGIYLWWPRGRNVGVATVKRTRGRPLWRDLHAVTGIYTAVFIVFLAFSGLPWSGVWGSYFYDLSYKAGIGMPDGYWDAIPTSTVPTGEALDRAPWVLEKQLMPASDHAAHGAAVAAASIAGVPPLLDAVVATAEARGIHPGYAVTMPRGAEGVFTASVYPDDVTQERVIHLDQYSGDVLLDMTLADLGALGAAAEWGGSIHMGQAFGLLNQLVLLGACITIVLMSVSAAVMWWKRRPAGSLGAPTMPADFRIPRAVLVMAVVAGVFFPLVGLTLLVVAAVELVLYLATRRRQQPA